MSDFAAVRIHSKTTSIFSSRPIISRKRWTAGDRSSCLTVGAPLEELIEQVAQHVAVGLQRSRTAARPARPTLRDDPNVDQLATQFSTSSRMRPNVCISVSTSKASSGRAHRKRRIAARSGDCTSAWNRASISARVGRAAARRAKVIDVRSCRDRSRRWLHAGCGSTRSGTCSISRFISTASRFRWPWQRTGLAPPLVSIMTFEKNRFVSISTDATCAMWIDCSRRPNHCGV